MSNNNNKTNNSSAIQIGGSGYHHYSPISTLERQSLDPNRILLFLQVNSHCCSVSVESILKLQTKNATVLSTEGTILADPQEHTSDSSDPFSFLAQETTTTNTNPTTNTTASANKKGPNLGRFVQRIAKSTTQSLERGMHNLAIRADQGRNPDLFIMGLYNNNNNACIAMTESQANTQLPSHDMRFVVPLVIPSNQEQTVVAIKLWVRSGAALLQGTNAAKNFLVGTAHIDVAQLRTLLQGKNNKYFTTLQLNLQSHVVADAQVQVIATTDRKLPSIGGRGWSICDPTPSGYLSGMFNTPLDQAYGFELFTQPSACLLAVERSVESTVILPLATAMAQIAARASIISLQHAESWKNKLYADRHDSAVGEYVDCQMSICYLKTTQEVYSTPFVTVSWQRPTSIFEVQLLTPTKIPVQTNGDGLLVIPVKFYPKPTRQNILPSVLQAHQGRFPPCGFFLGSVRIEIIMAKPRSASNGYAENPFGNPATGSPSLIPDEEVWECVLQLETLLQRNNNMMDVPLYHNGQSKGSIVLSVALTPQNGPNVSADVVPAAGGLVSLMGLDPLIPNMQPPLDRAAVVTEDDPQFQRRQRQLETMGSFVTYAYLDYHIRTVRSTDAEILQDRAKKYYDALVRHKDSKKPSPHEDRTPKPFRPSSSRSEMLLSGIAFNVHTASLSLEVLDPQNATEPPSGPVFYNITCGAPAAHARGFGNVFPTKNAPNIGLNSPIGPVAGGLRRLEQKRQELAKQVNDLETTLVSHVANFFTVERQMKRLSNHVPGRNIDLQNLRWKVYEAVHSLHHVTWICAVRRADVFSQAMGLAITSYLTSLSDLAKWQSTWPDFWARHGYLVSFEGLLSAAGKELGMIEDASVAISMLQMVQIVLVADDGVANTNRVPIYHSPSMKWVDVSVSGSGSTAQYNVHIGVVPSYYQERVPNSLKNGKGVRLYPLLFEVGVDIRQWAAYSGSNMKSQLNSSNEKEPTGGLIDDEDDDAGVSDTDVLVQINYEAFRKMNEYAFRIAPSQTQSMTQPQQKTHPLLETLYQHIVGSAGKMNHDILDEAAVLAAQLGGGGVVFCKSGKDRTAMHVTYKMAQFESNFRQRGQSPISLSVPDSTLPDAKIMRVHGTRLPICQKNVGESKYAFNSLQVKFMPDALKPPMNTLAGFLKGGKVFTGSAIES